MSREQPDRQLVTTGALEALRDLARELRTQQYLARTGGVDVAEVADRIDAACVALLRVPQPSADVKALADLRARLQAAEQELEHEQIEHQALSLESAQAFVDAAELKRLRAGGYVQHSPTCAKVTRETMDGHRVRVYPWDADKIDCTCQLDPPTRR